MNTNEFAVAAEDEWQRIRSLIDAPARNHVERIINRDASALSDSFYTEMLSDPRMHRWLDHETVNRRLHASMERWLKSLFDDATPTVDLVAVQRKTGEVHARIGVPYSAISAGARILKRGIARRLMDEPGATAPLASAVQYAYELIDIAMDLMEESAGANAMRKTRTDESYRLFFLTQNLRTERERQKSQLLEWAHQILVRNYWEAPIDEPDESGPQRRASQFQLWIEHKASMLFENAPELGVISESIERIESTLLPRLKESRTSRSDAKDVVVAMNREVESIKELLATMFDRASETENGRDYVTRLLNRRYFPSIVTREINLVQAGGPAFALLLVDIDRFAAVMNSLGREATDGILGQIADSLNESVRAGDFCFRVADDQFLLLIVDADEGVAVNVAEALRGRLAALVLRTNTGVSPAITASIGVAVHDGHPDYQRLLERAEAALRTAKAAGRNRVEVAPPLGAQGM